MKKIILSFICLILLSGCAQQPPENSVPYSCKDSLDCPKLMKCENSVCIDVGCIEEGKTGPSAGINPEWLDHLPQECCEGLKFITYSGYFDDNCERTLLVGAPSAVCAKCGDGQCKEGETKCNCPEDCK